jgi:hypothetical protein
MASKNSARTNNRRSNAGPKRKASGEESPTNRPATARNKRVLASNDDNLMIFILSPSKTLDLDETMHVDTPIPWTFPDCDLEKTNKVIRAMKQHITNKTASLTKLLGISANLAVTAHSYWENIRELQPNTPSTSPPPQTNNKPAIYSFTGAAYLGLDVDNLDTAAVGFLQRHLRIIDPLYGWLRPMDVIQPYRLEMATRNILSKQQQGGVSPKLHDYWKPAIRTSIANERLQHQQADSTITIINVASDEYSAAVDYQPHIKVVFRHEGRVIGVHAKRARGLFLRYCAQNRVHRVPDLKGFNLEGYTYQATQSDETTLVFNRQKNWSQK